MNIQKGDTVVILSGTHKGKTGRVLTAFPKERKVIVERVQLVKRHTKPGRQGMQQGGIVEREAAIHVSKVALVDPRSSKATRVRHPILADGSKVRTSAHSGEVIERSR